MSARMVPRETARGTASWSAASLWGHLGPEDGDMSVGFNQDSHGPEVIWSRAARHVALGLGEGHAEDALEMDIRIGRTEFGKEDLLLLREAAESRKRAASTGGDGLRRPAEVQAAEVQEKAAS